VKRRSVRVALSILISAIFLAFAVRNVDWAEALAALQEANYLLFLPILGVTVWTLYIRAQRWRLLLRPIGAPPMRPLVAAVNIGFMANMVLPLRIGEVIRPVLASRRAHLPLSSVLATVLLERIFDMFTVLLLFALSALLVPVSAQVRAWGITLTLVVVGIGGLIALMRWQEHLALGLARNVCELFPSRLGEPTYGFFQGFLKALEILDSPRAFFLALLWSLYLWMVICLVSALALAAFDLPLLSAVVLTAIVAAAVSVPSAPGYIGSFQLGCVVALAVFGVSKSDAIAFSIFLHMSQFVAVIGAGLYSLWTENMSFRQIEAVEQQNGALA
jgi:hypothetical protein